MMSGKQGVIILFVCLILSVAPISTLSTPHNSHHPTTIRTMSQEDNTSFWHVVDNVILSFEDMIIHDFIIVESNGTLSIFNSIVSFEALPYSYVGIRIESGGHLEIRNSQVTSDDYSFWNITAQPGSSLNFYNCSMGYSHIGTTSEVISLNNASSSISYCSFNDASSAFLNLRNIQSIDLHNCTFRAVTDAAIYVVNCSALILDNLTISDTSGPAILVEESDNVILKHINAHDTMGISVINCVYAEILSSDIHDSIENGLAIMRSDFVNVHDVNITQTRWAAIDIQRSSGIIVNSSYFDTSDVSDYELHTYMSTDIIICRNNFTSVSGFAGFQMAGTSHCIFAHNIFNPWLSFSFGVDSGNYSFDFDGYGNYWSTYHGIDQNNDGIGDTPYNPHDLVEDNYPLMRPEFPPFIPIPNNYMRYSNNTDSIIEGNSTGTLPSDTAATGLYSALTPLWITIVCAEIFIAFFILKRKDSTQIDV